MNGQVNSLTVYSNELIAGGMFFMAGDVIANGIARWDGSTWQPLGSGLNDTAHAVSVVGPDVYVGGKFTDTAGHARADYLVRWGSPLPPPVFLPLVAREA